MELVVVELVAGPAQVTDSQRPADFLCIRKILVVGKEYQLPGQSIPLVRVPGTQLEQVPGRCTWLVPGKLLERELNK